MEWQRILETTRIEFGETGKERAGLDEALHKIFKGASTTRDGLRQKRNPRNEIENLLVRFQVERGLVRAVVRHGHGNASAVCSLHHGASRRRPVTQSPWMQTAGGNSNEVKGIHGSNGCMQWGAASSDTSMQAAFHESLA